MCVTKPRKAVVDPSRPPSRTVAVSRYDYYVRDISNLISTTENISYITYTSSYITEYINVAYQSMKNNQPVRSQREENYSIPANLVQTLHPDFSNPILLSSRFI